VSVGPAGFRRPAVDEPRVSVLVACRDAAPWLGEALASALGQTLEALEVILVDDGSRDESPRIGETFAARDGRLRLVRHPTSQGSAAARNTALGLARGRWIAVFDADDRMEPERLARLVATAERVGADWLADDQLIEAEGTGWPPARLLLDEPAGASRLDAARFLDRDPPEAIGYGTAKPLVRRAFLVRTGIRWRPEAGRSDDFAFTLDCLAAGASCWLLNEPLYRYRLRPASQVTSLSGSATLVHQLEVQALAERLLEGRASPEVRAALARRRRRIEAARRYRAAIEAVRAGAAGRLLGLLARDRAVLTLLARGLAEAARARLTGRRVPTLANRRLFHADA
jgi:succinoglycan biosynthesis protein ExoO